MSTAAQVTASPNKTRKGRTVPAVQPSTNFINSSAIEDNTARLQLQRLRSHAVFSASLAGTIAALAWEVRHG